MPPSKRKASASNSASSDSDAEGSIGTLLISCPWVVCDVTGCFVVSRCAGSAMEAQCFFRSRPGTTCEHKGWIRKSQGKWDTSVGGKKFTLLDGYGKPTEIGWRVIDNTGITEEDFLDQHQAGSQAVLPVNAVCNRIWWMFLGEQLLCCQKCIRWIDGWRDKHKQQQATWATFALDVSDLPAIRHRRRLGAGTVTSVLTCTCMKSVDLVGQVRLTFTNALGRPTEELIDDPQVCIPTHPRNTDPMMPYFLL